MRVTALSDAEPGGEARFRVDGGPWPAIWMGSESICAGTQVHVEMDIDSIDSIVAIDGADAVSGIEVVDGRLTVRGTVSLVYQDGVFALQVGAGSVLIEPDPGFGVSKGMAICIEPESISLFPIGV
ncbi:hypothetical protein ACFVUS_34825 [Nocardia sp. NPDC058058]|uniref:hypothetical protein n=1 Tax=Nocardia sp. NPDC058058 TaxID=3346317 RepID=UPI0036D9E573